MPPQARWASFSSSAVPRLYAEALPRAERLYLTLVHAQIEGDARFPPWDPADWIETARVEHPADGRNPFPMTFLTLDRAPRR